MGNENVLEPSVDDAGKCSGNITDMFKLPVTGLSYKGVNSGIYIKLGPLICSPG